MSKQRNALVLLFGSVLVCLGISGCTRTASYRWNLIEHKKIASLPLKCDGNSKDPCRAASIEKTKKYTLFFVELDEQGRFYDRRQIEALLNLLKDKRKSKEKAKEEVTAKCNGPDSSFGDMSIVTFVHGWRHNAEYDDTNVALAREILEFTANGEQLLPHPNPSGCPRETVGVYLGWRGLSTTAGLHTKVSNNFLSTLLAPWELISVWDRKNTSQNMAVGSARELFSVLRAFQEDQNNDLTVKGQCDSLPHPRTSEDKNSKNIFDIYHCKPVRLLIVGHSFGGLIAYNAVAGQLLDSVTRGAFVKPEPQACQDEYAPPTASTLPPTAMVRSYADLIVLINPAIEGVRYEPLHQAVNYRAKIPSGEVGAFCPNQRPVMVAITSKYDWATGVTFWASRFLNTLFESTHPNNPNFTPEERNYVSEEEYRTSINTLGHVERFHTHRLNGASQLIEGVNEETDSYAKGLREYCNSHAQPATEIEKSLKRCRCGGEWHELPNEKAKDKKEEALIEKSNDHAQACRAFIGEKNMADMLAGKNPPWLMPIEESNGIEFRKDGRRQTFCGGATLTHLPVYKRSEDLKKQLEVHNSPSSPVWDGYKQLEVHNSPSSPVWNVYAMDKKIIDGHSDIHKGVFKQFLQQLYHILTVKNFNRENFEKFGENAVVNFNNSPDGIPCTEDALRIPPKQSSRSP